MNKLAVYTIGPTSISNHAMLVSSGDFVAPGPNITGPVITTSTGTANITSGDTIIVSFTSNVPLGSAALTLLFGGEHL